MVEAAQAAGHDVVSLSRGEIDLAKGDGLAVYLKDAEAVIHTAAGSGDEGAHARDTLKATEVLVRALPDAIRFVLVSSLSVYCFEGIPDWSLLDETAPIDPDSRGRDAYAHAKITQEKLAVKKAQTEGLDLWIARPGAIYGTGRIHSARLGWRKASFWLCPGGDVPVPAIHVTDCAAALVAAATVEDQSWPEDLPILRGGGHVRITNLVSKDAPTQLDWLTAIHAKKRIKLPLKLLMYVSACLELLVDTVPLCQRYLPLALRPQTLTARFKPLFYSTHRLEDRLGHTPAQSFADSMAAAIKIKT
ncbi:NAD-dependent epimerase/dehydratase family protein [Roseibium sp.]|uniref:NAD-dependent epimerase/dehydratase family protein n=1 Tax=Roseibium sp. TaxID=1936156 RepID=UPI003B506881